MLDLNIPTTNPITTTTLTPYEHDQQQQQQQQQHELFTAEMSNSLQFDTISSYTLAYDTTKTIAMSATNTTSALNWNLSQQLQAGTAATNVSSTAAAVASSTVPLVNVATNFIYDWCNQSSSYPAISTGNGNGIGSNCSLYSSTLNSWNNSTNDTSM